LTERRRHHPQGVDGGQPGRLGENLLALPDKPERAIDTKTTRDVPAGSVVTVRTPGGGGHGTPDERAQAAREQDAIDGKVTVDGTNGDGHTGAGQ